MCAKTTSSATSILNKVEQEIKQKQSANTPPSKTTPVCLLDGEAALQEILPHIKPIKFVAGTEQTKVNVQDRYVQTIDTLLITAKTINRPISCENGVALFIYNGQYHVPIETWAVTFFLGEVAERAGFKAHDARFYAKKKKLYKQLISAAHTILYQPITKYYLVNIANGTLRFTKTGQVSLQPHRAEDNFKYCLPTEYNPDATCPMFDKFLNQMLPDKESQSLLNEALGHSLVPKLKLEYIILLYGHGRNGKSVIYDIVKRIFALKNMSSYSIQELVDDSGYCRSDFVTKLLNFCPDAGSRFNASGVFKRLSSGETIIAREIYGKPHEYENYPKIICNINNFNYTGNDLSDGDKRRFLPIIFPVQISKEEVNVHLAEELCQTELPGIFNWMVKGAQKILINHGFTNCKASEALLGEWWSTADPVLGFLEEYELSPGTNPHSLQEVYKLYSNYCAENKCVPLGYKLFSKALQNKCYQIKKQGSRARAIYFEDTKNLNI